LLRGDWCGISWGRELGLLVLRDFLVSFYDGGEIECFVLLIGDDLEIVGWGLEGY
jgi:hypothetical protein